MGVFPRMLKSYALCVYFQRYSPSITRCFPNACCSPAWNSFLNPAGEFAGTHGIKAAITSTLQPVVATTRFSLNGVSNVRLRDPQHGIGRLDVVRDSEPWLDFAH